MSKSEQEDGGQQSKPLLHSRRQLFRNFVFLEKKLRCVPSKKAYEDLKKEGRIKKILFTRNDSVAEMKGKLISHFPNLAGKDFSQ